MREEDSDWFSKWEEELPPPEELTPLSQTLISPDLALAFDIHPPNSANNFYHHQAQNHHQRRRTSPAPLHQSGSGDFDSSSGGGGAGSGSGGDETARTLKRPRLVWTPQLHKRFVDAVAHLGIKNAVPKTIMQLMSVDGLTRENVASHLQKYRLYLKRMQGLNNGGGAGGGIGDPATDHLFASSPVPAHLLAGGRPHEHLMGHVPPPAAVAALHHHQMAAMVAGGQYHHQRQMGHFGSPTTPSNAGGGGGHFEHPFLSRQAQMNVRGMLQNSGSGYEDGELGTPKNGRKVLTLFPSADD